MPKHETERLRLFRKEYARMVEDFRQFVHAPNILIGKATLILLDQGETVTRQAITDLISGLDDEMDTDLVARTIQLLGQHQDTSTG